MKLLFLQKYLLVPHQLQAGPPGVGWPQGFGTSLQATRLQISEDPPGTESMCLLGVTFQGSPQAPVSTIESR